jgi:GAF domain-containing protein
LREISSSGAAIDLTRYRLEDYPATETVLRTGDPAEIHRNDPTADPAERIVLARANRASLLIIPFVVGGERVGILELAHRTHRRWTSHDVAHGHALAAHVGQALSRISC